MPEPTYRLITVDPIPFARNKWNMTGHIGYDDMRHIDTVPTFEQMRTIIQRHGVPVLFCRPDSKAVLEFFSDDARLEELQARIQDLKMRLAAEEQYSTQLRTELDADPIKQAQAANEALMQENAALRNDIQRLQEALDGGLLTEVLSLRQEMRLIGQYAEYYHEARAEGQGNPNDPDTLADDLAMPFEMWLDAYATTPNDE